MPDWTDAMSKDERDAWEDWLRYQQGTVLPAMRDSKVILSIAPLGKPDAKFCVETGMALMLDKPIILLVDRGAHVPPKLRLVADEIIEADINDEADRARIAPLVAAAMQRLGA